MNRLCLNFCQSTGKKLTYKIRVFLRFSVEFLTVIVGLNFSLESKCSNLICASAISRLLNSSFLACHNTVLVLLQYEMKLILKIWTTKERKLWFSFLPKPLVTWTLEIILTLTLSHRWYFTNPSLSGGGLYVPSSLL